MPPFEKAFDHKKGGYKARACGQVVSQHNAPAKGDIQVDGRGRAKQQTGNGKLDRKLHQLVDGFCAGNATPDRQITRGDYEKNRGYNIENFYQHSSWPDRYGIRHRHGSFTITPDRRSNGTINGMNRLQSQYPRLQVENDIWVM